MIKMLVGLFAIIALMVFFAIISPDANAYMCWCILLLGCGYMLVEYGIKDDE